MRAPVIPWGPPVTSRAVLLAVLVVSALLALSMGGSPRAAAEDAAATGEEFAYLLVIDHSSSMVSPEPGKPVLWPPMKARAAQFVGVVPEGSLVWIATFEGRFRDRSGREVPGIQMQRFSVQDDASRAAAVAHVNSLPDPPRSGAGTALYDAVLRAFEEASRLGVARPDRHVSVMLYSDGEDTHSTAKAPQVVERWGRLRDQVRDVWLWYTPLLEEVRAKVPVPLEDRVRYGEPKIPLPVRVRELGVGLKNPKTTPRQTFRLTLAVSPRAAAVLAGREAQLSFVPDAGTSILTTLTPATLVLTQGPHEIAIEVAAPGALPGDREFSGRITLGYPTLEEYFVQGPGSVRVTFDKATQAGLRDVRPRGGSVFAVGQEVAFHAESRADSTVRWEFDDGRTATGSATTRSFMKAGPTKVVVTAMSDPSLPPTRAEIGLQIVDVGAEVVAPGRVFAGRPVGLAATGRGEGVRFRWEIEDSAWAGEGPIGDRLTYTFPSAGRYRVRVVAVASVGEFPSRDVVLDVEDAPGVAIASPASGTEVVLGETVAFDAAVSGRVERVRWTISAGGRPVHAEETAVAPRGAGRGAALQFAFDEAWGEGEALVEAAPVPGSDGSDPSRIRLRLGRPRRGIAIVVPAAGAGLRTEAETVFEAEVSAADVVEVRWRIDVVGASGALAERTAPVTGGRSRLAHRFHEGPELFTGGATRAAIEVTATLLRRAAAGPALPSDRRIYEVVMGARGVRAVEPAPGAPYRYGGETAFRAEVEGAGVVGVRWRVRAEDGSELDARDADVVEDGARRAATFAFRFEEARTLDNPISVIATARLAPGVAGPAAEATWSLPPPPFSVEVVDPRGAGATHRIGAPVPLTLRCSHGVAEATWRVDGAPAPGGDVRGYAPLLDRAGSHVVTATVRSTSGRTAEASTTVVVTAVQPTPQFEVLRGTEARTKFYLRDHATLRDTSLGDVGRHVWLVDGVPQESPDLTSVAVRRLRVALQVWGKPDATGAESGPFDASEVQIVFVEDRRFVLWGVLSLAVGILAAAWRFFLGNALRDLRIGVRAAPEAGAAEDAGVPPSFGIARAWSRWSKRARLPVKKFHPRATVAGVPSFWHTTEGARSYVEVGWDPVRRSVAKTSLVERAAFLYSAAGNNNVTWSERRRAGTRDDRRFDLRDLRDARAAETRLVWYLLGPTGRRAGVFDRVGFLLTVLGLTVALLWVASWAGSIQV